MQYVHRFYITFGDRTHMFSAISSRRNAVKRENPSRNYLGTPHRRSSVKNEGTSGSVLERSPHVAVSPVSLVRAKQEGVKRRLGANGEASGERKRRRLQSNIGQHDIIDLTGDD
jgi:hypothetical protein